MLQDLLEEKEKERELMYEEASDLINDAKNFLNERENRREKTKFLQEAQRFAEDLGKIKEKLVTNAPKSEPQTQKSDTSVSDHSKRLSYKRRLEQKKDKESRMNRKITGRHETILAELCETSKLTENTINAVKRAVALNRLSKKRTETPYTSNEGVRKEF